MSELKMKTCNKCKKEKELSCFVSDKGKETKRCDYCRKQQLKINNNAKCSHGIIKYRCRECGGSSICEHDKRKDSCIKCDGAGICKHKRRKEYCKDCKGTQICKHDKINRECLLCGGGRYCEHKKRKEYCRDCKGSGICHHDKRRKRCKVCRPLGHLIMIVRARVNGGLKVNKSKKSIEYLGCTIEEYKIYLEDKFVEGMTWDNYGSEWHIDHIIPLMYENPTIEEVAERLHYKNTQPLWAIDNISKGRRYIG